MNQGFETSQGAGAGLVAEVAEDESEESASVVTFGCFRADLVRDWLPCRSLLRSRRYRRKCYFAGEFWSRWRSTAIRAEEVSLALRS
jgi:hypothetical protein